MAVEGGAAKPVYITNNPPFMGGAAEPVVLMGADGVTPLAVLTSPLSAAQIAALGIDALRDLTRAYIRDEFASAQTANGSIGELGWAFTGGTVTMIVAEASHPGIVRRDTSATINTLTSLIGRFTSAAGSFLPAELFDLTWIFRLNTNDANTLLRVGAANDLTANPPSNGIYLEKLDADTNWFFVCRSGGAQTRANSGVATGTGWVKLRIRRTSATAIAFSLNGGAEMTIAANVPTATLLQGLHILNSAAAAKTVDVDYCDLLITGMTR